MMPSRSIWLVPLGALTVVVLTNVSLFVTGFPGVAAAPSSVIVSRLPLIPDAYRPPAVPPFTSTLTARSIYFSASSPWPQTLLARRSDDTFPLASLTKLMSALVVLEENPDWGAVVSIEAGDRRGGARTPLSTGAQVTVEDLWTLSLVSSDNDATAALSRHVAGSEEAFVKNMNALAAELGLSQTTFVEPTGLSAANVGSARDVAVVARRAFADEKILTTLALSRATVQVSGKSVTIFSSDQLVKSHLAGANRWTFETAKTGYVDESGYNVVLRGKTETGEELLLVIMGSTSLELRAKEVEQLFAWAAAPETRGRP